MQKNKVCIALCPNDTKQRYKSLRDLRYVAYATRYAFGSICLLGKRGIYIISKATEDLQSKSGGYIELERCLHSKPREYIEFALVFLGTPRQTYRQYKNCFIGRAYQKMAENACILCHFRLSDFSSSFSLMLQRL